MKPPSIYQGVFPKTFKQPEGQIAEYYYKALTKKKNVPPDLAHDEGSGVHGQPRAWEKNQSNGVGASGQTEEEEEHSQGQNRTINETDPLELDRIRREVAQEMARSHKTAGNIPGGWARWAKEKMTPVVNWRKMLKHRLSIARSNGMGHKIDYSYAMPGRRQSITFPLLLPRLTGSMDGNIAVVIDTSGSMSKEYIGQAISEVFEILSTFGCKVFIIPCDYAAYSTITISKPSELFDVKQLTGGGGTDMRNGIDAALDLKPLPDAVLVLTDGYTPYPNKPHQKVPIMFGIIKTEASEETPLPNMPPWHTTSVVPIVLKK
jgi:predicted metal-dependent peptidase